MEMGMRMRPALKMTHEMKLTHAQRLAVDGELLQLRLDVIEAVHGERFDPRGDCPKCFHELTGLEILRGFNEDPNDATTECPKCKTRFAPKLHRGSHSGWTELAFYCPVQTLDRLPPLRELPLEQFEREHRAIYNSAIVHFGGLRQAYARLGMKYAFETELDWRKRVVPFLGKLPDTVLAGLVGAPAKQIGKLRREHRIPVYSRSERAEELEPAN